MPPPPRRRGSRAACPARPGSAVEPCRAGGRAPSPRWRTARRPRCCRPCDATTYVSPTHRDRRRRTAAARHGHGRESAPRLAALPARKCSNSTPGEASERALEPTVVRVDDDLARSGRRARPRAPTRTTAPAPRGRSRRASARTAAATACPRRRGRGTAPRANCSVASRSSRARRPPRRARTGSRPSGAADRRSSIASSSGTACWRRAASRAGAARASGADGSSGRSVTSSELCAGSCGVQLSGLPSSPCTSASSSIGGKIEAAPRPRSGRCRGDREEEQAHRGGARARATASALRAAGRVRR